MAGRGRDDALILDDVPDHQRHRVLSGMRWTVWLSAIVVPFSAAFNFILARLGPETIAVLGLLSVYIGLVSSIFYFGGDTVVIRFIPECRREDRAAFLYSYLLVIITYLGLWLLVAWFYPPVMRLVLGHQVHDRANFLLVCLAPILIAFQMIVACLKGMLEIKLSQALAKLLIVSSLFAYGVILLFDRKLMVREPQAVIWGIYLGFAAFLALGGATRICQLCGFRNLRFYVPKGFWRYSFDTQMVSAVSFLTGRLDYLLILNFGGLASLGRYVAIMSVAAAVPLLNSFFMETLLPSLTNMVAARNDAGGAQVFMMHMRILLLVSVVGSCAVMVLAEPAVWMLGPKYAGLERLIIAATLLRGIEMPGPYGGTLLASVGRQRLAVWTGAFQVMLFSGLFLVFWPRWVLMGAVIANGLARIICGSTMMSVARRVSGIYPSITRPWTKAAAVQAGVGFIALWGMPLGVVSGCVTWLAAVGIFLYISGYDLAEFRGLAGVFIPGASGVAARA
jgi:O-antigen/teichoic acid export membrane protein